MPLNEPGNWRYFISHVQVECSTEAVMVAAEWGKQHCWLDRYMEDKSVAAMEEGVKGSETFVCILSEGYFKSEYCCNEMRWAFDNEKPIISTYKNGINVGALLNTAPDDFRERIMAIDSITLNASDPDYFNVGMSKITKRLGKLSVAPSSPPLVGTYECHKYDGTKNKNDWHYVTIKAEGSQLRWSNRAGVSWMLTPRAEGNLDVGKECPYYKNGHTVCQVVRNSAGSVTSLLGPWGEPYDAA